MEVTSAWLLYALLAPMLFGAANLFDKVLTKKFHPVSLNVAAGLAAGIALLMFPFMDLSLPLWAVVLSLVSGVFWFLAGFPYFKAISIEEASRVAPLWQLAVPMTLIMAVIFLDERLPALSYVAMALVFLGAFLVSVRDVKKTLRITPAFWLMLLANALIAASSVLTKALYPSGSFLHIQFFLLVGNFFAAAAVFVASGSIRKNIISAVKAGGRMRALFAPRMASETLGYVFLNLALLTGSASLTSALDGLSGFFVFIAATFISIWRPSLFKEELDRKTLSTKAVAIALILVGLLLMR